MLQLSTDLKSSESRNEIAPKSSLSIVLGQATQVYISILKAGHLLDLGQPENILKAHFPLYSVQKMAAGDASHHGAHFFSSVSFLPAGQGYVRSSASQPDSGADIQLS